MDRSLPDLFKIILTVSFLKVVEMVLVDWIEQLQELKKKLMNRFALNTSESQQYSLAKSFK